jgi:hypothetical protein
MQVTSSEFNNAFVQDEMYLDHKVIVEFGSNRFNDGQVVTASSTKTMQRGIDNLQAQEAEFWKASDVYNNMNHNTMKWLVCDAGATLNAEADGSGYRCVPVNSTPDIVQDFERGWWSAVRSDGSGIFTAGPQWVQSEFFEEDGITPFQRRANKIVLYTTDGYDNMKEVTVEYKNTLGAWIEVENLELGPAEYEHTWTFDAEDIIITGLRVSVHSTYRPNDWARLNELNAYFIEDISDWVINIDVQETKENYEGAVPIGTTAANTLNVELDNTEGHFNQASPDSIFAPYLGGNCRVEVYLGIDKNQGVGSPDYEYVQKGEYWTDEWEGDGSSVTARFTARDFSKRLQDDMLFWGRVWRNTNIVPVMRDVLLMLGLPLERINIDETNLRGYQILFIKDESPWAFFGEISLADQGMFGFDHKGDFFYQSYHVMNDEPYLTSVMDFDWDENIISGSNRTQLHVNKVKVKVSPYNTSETGTRPIWGPESPTILSWAKLGANIGPADTTIPVVQATRQETGNLTLNGWTDKNGYLFLPVFQFVTEGGIQKRKVVGGELIKYKNRTDSAFLECERGYLDTVPQSFVNGSYIGEARVWDIEFDNSPASPVKYPFVTAIDSLVKIPDEGIPQAHIIHWENNAFLGKLAIGNVVDYYTWLAGTGQTFKDFDNKDADAEINFATSISGEVVVEKAGRTETVKIDDPSAENADFIRRYGKNELEINNRWIQTISHAEDFADAIIDEYKTPRDVIELEVVMSPALELSDRIRVVNYPQLDIENTEYHVVSAGYSYNGGLMVNLTLRQVKPDG